MADERFVVLHDDGLRLHDGVGRALHEQAFARIGGFVRGAAMAEAADGRRCLLRLDGTCDRPPTGEVLKRWPGDEWMSAGGSVVGYVDGQLRWTIEPAFTAAGPFVRDKAIVAATRADAMPAPASPAGAVVGAGVHPGLGVALAAFVRGGERIFALMDAQARWWLPRDVP